MATIPLARQTRQCIGECDERRPCWKLLLTISSLSIEFRNQTKINKSDLEVYAMFLPMAMFFYILFYVSMPFNEERTEFKKLQPISPFVYWTSVYMFDALIHAIYSYFMYTVHIWADSYHVFEEKEYGKCGSHWMSRNKLKTNFLDHFLYLRSDVLRDLFALRSRLSADHLHGQPNVPHHVQHLLIPDLYVCDIL